MLNWIKKTLAKKRLPAKQPVGKKTSRRSSGQAAGKATGKGSRRRSKKSSRSASTAASTVAGNKDVIVLSRSQHGISRNNIDDHALKVLYRLHKAGYHACLVGGAVRDLLLGHKPKDFDVATDATPEQVSKLFRNCRLIGRRFRLAHIHFGRTIIEVATFRADHDMSQLGIQDDSGRIVRDNVFGELADDVWRRDFTANALYYDIADFSVIDFVGGFEDIQKKRLHLIGDVETRYREDPVRMLRAIRFSAKLGFEIDEKSRTPIYSLGHLLQDIPPARLYEEILKLFHSGHAVRSFELLLEFDLLQYLFPEAAISIKDDEQVKKMLLIAMNNTDDRILNDMRVTPAFLFAALLWQPVNSRVKEFTDKGMPYSVAIQKSATRILSQQSKSASIPKRFTSTMRDIWSLQTRFHYRAGKRAQAVLEHEKFRAGYDFLCIRAQAGEAGTVNELSQDCEWWTDIQKLSPEKQRNMLFETKKSGKPKRRRRSKKPKASHPDHSTDSVDGSKAENKPEGQTDKDLTDKDQADK
ncbi:MAG: polynucleotide adenylyltransferase PcnB [Proteobacteria bacterium]|nr:polynucleotide adenylyltransferase PcnB [Pseudomonadota bacterium]